MSRINNEQQEGEKSYPFARWMSWLFLVASIALLIYTYYRSEIAFLGLQEGYFKYYLIALTGILFWGVVLRLREEIQANIVTVACSLVVGLYLVEGTLTVFRLGGEIQQRSQLAAKQGVEYDERTKLEVIDDLIAEGVDAVPAAQGWSFIRIIGTNKEDIGHLFPLGGVSNKTAVHHNETGLWAIYLNDRHGFNNPGSIPLALSVFMFLILGISNNLLFIEHKYSNFFYCGLISIITETFMWDASNSIFFWIIILYAITISQNSYPPDNTKYIKKKLNEKDIGYSGL